MLIASIADHLWGVGPARCGPSGSWPLDADCGSLPAGSGISIGSLLPFGNAMLAGTAGLGVHSNAAGDWASANDGLFGSAISRLLALDGG